MVFLFTGAVVGMYFQPPLLRTFFGMTGLEPGAGTGKPIAVPPLPPDAAPAPPPPSVTALGRLIPEGDVVRLAAPYGAGDARISRLLVRVGDKILEGQPIAELDSLQHYRTAVAAATANVAAKEAALDQARSAVSAALAEAKADRDRAASAANLARNEANRIGDLFSRGVATQATLDRAEAAAVQAARELDRAEAHLARQEGGESQPDVALAARQLDVARAELASAEGDLSRGQVFAPQAGRILALHVGVGERPGTDGIASLGTTERMEAELEVYQTDIERVAPEQDVTLSSAALAEPLTGKVTKIGLEVERQSILSANPAANTDARIIRVTVALDPDSSARASGLTGLEVTGRIETGRSQ
ncbi:HlyD family efflux transporter periplasmic adaptor subunit [Roseovarius sp. THAF27]|uniref:HlyD family efflux transporter periplasmic adaptor subunit n=1 Tax=Roseovarius sp. THAF27 TaxID=2587850 RepID=UPI0015626BD3|nr:HlyD family efflux transporter periplasmic adaptor subunit [Roseovarius sp. THAF27]